MLPAEPHRTIPSLDDVFGCNAALLRVLKQSNFWSVAPIMLMPKQALMELRGIMDHRATYITGALAEHGLGQIRVHERTRDFLTEQFGSPDNAPADVLNVTRIRRFDFGSRPVYAPLRMVRTLTHITPNITISDMLNTSESEMLDLVCRHLHFGPVLERMRDEDLPEVNSRMIQIDPRFHIGTHVTKEATRLHLAGGTSQ